MIKKNNSEPDLQKLIESYKIIYESQVRDFNALSTIHMSENDHTNVLCEILNLKILEKKPFMESFVKDVLRINGLCYDNLVAKTQVRALGTAKNVTKKNKESAGFIDLLIEEEEDPHTFIIVENKVCGAGDGDDQLARYYFTYKKDEEALKNYYAQDSDFRGKCEKYWADDNKATDENRVYLVYLTDYTKEDQQTDEDAKEKCPSETSINPSFLGILDEQDKYRHISYEEHIYSWLKDQVLPLMPYGKTGDAHHSVLLYIRELENMFATNDAQNKWYLENSKIQEQIICPILGQRNTNTEQYKALDKAYKDLKQIAEKSREESSPALNDLLSCVLCYRNNVFGRFAPEGWTIYCSAGYITFYPTRWLNKYGGNKSCCIHFIISPWQRGQYKVNLNIHGNACKKYIIEKDDDHYKELKTALLIDSFVDGEGQFPDNVQDVRVTLSKRPEWHVAYNKKKITHEIGIPWNSNENVKDFFDKFVNSEPIKNVVDWIDNNL